MQDALVERLVVQFRLHLHYEFGVNGWSPVISKGENRRNRFV